MVGLFAHNALFAISDSDGGTFFVANSYCDLILYMLPSASGKTAIHSLGFHSGMYAISFCKNKQIMGWLVGVEL